MSQDTERQCIGGHACGTDPTCPACAPIRPEVPITLAEVDTQVLIEELQNRFEVLGLIGLNRCEDHGRGWHALMGMEGDPYAILGALRRLSGRIEHDIEETEAEIDADDEDPHGPSS